MERKSVFGNLFNDTRERALKRVYNPQNDTKYESRKREVNLKQESQKASQNTAERSYVLN